MVEKLSTLINSLIDTFTECKVCGDYTKGGNICEECDKEINETTLYMPEEGEW